MTGRPPGVGQSAEHRELLTRAHADSREGRVRELTEDQLSSLGG